MIYRRKKKIEKKIGPIKNCITVMKSCEGGGEEILMKRGEIFRKNLKIKGNEGRRGRKGGFGCDTLFICGKSIWSIAISMGSSTSTGTSAFSSSSFDS